MLAFHVTTTRANRVRKSFSLSPSVYQLNCLRTSKGLSLGELIRLQRIDFSHAFPLVLDSNLHYLNETNPGLMLFSAELLLRLELALVFLEEERVMQHSSVSISLSF